jgi:hypothetical protein
MKMTNQNALFGQPFQPVQAMQPKLTYVGRADVPETFVDSCVRINGEGFNVKVEFVVNRFDDPKPPAPPSGSALTACRLVMPIPGMLDLHAKLTQMIDALKTQGTIKQFPTMPPTAGIN